MRCQHITPGMAGGFPCNREAVEGSEYCERHQDDKLAAWELAMREKKRQARDLAGDDKR